MSQREGVHRYSVKYALYGLIFMQPSSSGKIQDKRYKEGIFGQPQAAHPAHPSFSLGIPMMKPEDFPVFQVLQAITLGFRHPYSTKQAHFSLFKMSCSARNRYITVILIVMFFNGWFLCPGGERSGTNRQNTFNLSPE